MHASITDIWARLRGFIQTNASDLGERWALNPGADRASLAKLSEKFDRIDPALLESLAVCNGQSDQWRAGFFLQESVLLSAERIIEHYEMLEDSLAEFKDPEEESKIGIGPVYKRSFCPHRIPFAEQNGDLTWFLDYDPAPGGIPGQVIRVDIESDQFLVCTNSFTEFLDDFVNAFEQGDIDIEDENFEEQSWPPLKRVSSLEPEKLDEARLRQLGNAGNWELVAELITEHNLAFPWLKLRAQADAQAESGEPKAAIATLERLAEQGHERDDDAKLRLRLIQEAHGDAHYEIALDKHIESHPTALWLQQRAEFFEDMASKPPKKMSEKKAIEWLLSAVGQSHSNGYMTRALNDLQQANALKPTNELKLKQAETLLALQRWDDASEVLSEMKRVLPDDADSDLIEEIDALLDRAANQDADEEADLFDELHEAMSSLREYSLDDDAAKALSKLSKLTDHLDGSIKKEKRKREQALEETDSPNDPAKHIAQQILGRFGKNSGRYTDFNLRQLSADDRRYYDRVEKTLETLGFQKLADVESLDTTEQLNHSVLLRIMSSADQLTIAVVWRFSSIAAIELESEEAANGELPRQQYLTNNTGASNPFAPPALIAQLSLPANCKPELLVQQHQTRIGAATALHRFDSIESVYAMFARAHAIKINHARANNWVSDNELKQMLSGAYNELAPQVRAWIAKLSANF
jgi:cell wall assembly regulator SMI1